MSIPATAAEASGAIRAARRMKRILAMLKIVDWSLYGRNSRIEIAVNH